ncbi:MAG: hypothetical protein CYG60_18980 [Actinobacteria bacterium]|nr:MAG: hypothetical protein CYG60_18980 [Actinomycetota bacterium]
MTKTEQKINEAIRNGERLTDAQVKYATKRGICLWGSVNYAEAEQAARNTPEARRIAKMSSVVDRFDVRAYQAAIYNNGWNA